ncbi:hypothetical protein AVEN_181465-1, partial [Araneus ventricosus]
MEENSAVKMPPFNFGDPQLWFIMAEATFQLAIPKPITASATKYNYCVAHLSPEAAAIVRDVITCPDKDHPYKQLKEELIKMCGESKSQEIRCLLAGEQLGDRKSTDLLRVMQRRSTVRHNTIEIQIALRSSLSVDPHQNIIKKLPLVHSLKIDAQRKSSSFQLIR